MQRDYLRKELLITDFHIARDETILPLLCGIYEAIELGGLLELEEILEFIQDFFLRKALELICGGIAPGDLLVIGLEKAQGAAKEEKQNRILLLTYFTLILHQADASQTDEKLKRFMQSSHKFSLLLVSSMKLTMPYFCKIKEARKLKLYDIITTPIPEEALTYRNAAIASLKIKDNRKAAWAVRECRKIFQNAHPFSAAFQDFMKTGEADRLGITGLLGVLRFGIVAEQDMKASYQYLEESREMGKTGPFAAFLLAMLYLYNGEGIPYDPTRALQFLTASAKRGNLSAAAWAVGFLLEDQTPLFPDKARKKKQTDSALLNENEIFRLLEENSDSIISSELMEKEFKGTEKVVMLLEKAGYGWDENLLLHQGNLYLQRGEVKQGWRFLKRAALLGCKEAMIIIASAWADCLPEKWKEDPLLFKKLKERIVRDRDSEVLLLLSVSCQECYNYIMIFMKKKNPLYSVLKKQMMKEMREENCRRKMFGGLSFGETEELLQKIPF